MLALVAMLVLATNVKAQNGQAGIDVRVGYGAEATRIVVDSPVPVSGAQEGPAAGEVDFMLHGPDAGIALQGQGHGLVSAWRLDAGEGGSRLTLNLNRRSRVVRTFLIPPGADTSMYRYVIDLSAADEAPKAPATVVAVAAPAAAAKPAVTVASDYPVPTIQLDRSQSATTKLATKVGAERAPASRAPRRVAHLAREPVPDEAAAGQEKPAHLASAAAVEIDHPVRIAKPQEPKNSVHLALRGSLQPSTNREGTVRLASVGGMENYDSASPLRSRLPDEAIHTPLRERKVIVIDAGHGGHDPGAQSDGESEKDITLAAATHLRHRLLRDGRYRVVMTRSSDVFVPLEERVRIARRAGADLFIALHADSAGDNDATHGASVYTLSGHGETRVKEVLNGHEWFNRPRNDPAVKGILLDLTQRSTLNRSNEFAQMLVDRLSEKIDVLPKTHRDAGYFVLLAPDVPAVLLEMGFITSPADQVRLTDPSKRNALMDTVGDAIDQYFRGDVRVAENWSSGR